MTATRSRLALAGGLAAAALALAGSPAAAAAPDDALASAVYGHAEVWWQRKADDRSRRELVFQARPDAAPRVIRIPSSGNPHRYSGLALGLDARRRLVVVVESARGLRWTRVSGTPRLHDVPGSTRADMRPSLFRGRLACVGSVGGVWAAVRLGSLARGGLRIAWESRAGNPHHPVQVAVGARDAVAVVTHREGASSGSYRAQLLRRDGTLKPLLRLPLGDAHVGGLSIDHVSTDGRRVTIARTIDDVVDHLVFALPSGRRIEF